MAKKAAVFSCLECGNQSPKWIGRCPECNAWNSYAEETPAAPSQQGLSAGSAPVPIDSIGDDTAPRISVEIGALDRVLGGGLVVGGITLVGGEPGIGKSTLLLQTAERLARAGVVLYVSGEESPRQIAMRARRLGTLHPNIHLYTETSVERIVAELERLRPVAAIVDSIQTVHTSLNGAMPGSVGQVRDSAGALMAAAKRLSIPIFLIGHITKEGTLAGPKSLEHIVDTVLYFEGDRFQNYRVVRACKNRFGPVNEVAIFQMHDEGLEEVANPSAALISQRSTAAGSAVLAAIEGTRPLLIEVQALVSPTHFPSPRRMAMGIDGNRVALLLAVLERRSGGSFVTHDVYVNIAGGLQIDEPALDLGILAAVLSSQRNLPIALDLAVFGEVGLLGEIRSVSQPDLRAREAAALGFRRVVVPFANRDGIHADVEVIPVRTVEDFAAAVFPRPLETVDSLSRVI
ncbi:MAG TPA: DNA repair protein RadA [Thermoanaerobaculia bacterium]|nr:DNA repair protein RadA [Thermoanaerobaculia bacterium]